MAAIAAAALMIATEGEEEMVTEIVVEVAAVAMKTVPLEMTANMAEKTRGEIVTVAATNGKVPQVGAILVLQNRRK